MSRRGATSFRNARENPVTNNFSNILKDWRKKGSIVVWIQTKSGLTLRLAHLIPYEFYDEEKKKKIIRYMQFVCHEDPRQYYDRNIPIQHCPIDRLVELIADDERIDDDQVVYEVSIGDSNKDRIYTKADFCSFKGANWQNSMKPRGEYVMIVVNDEDVNAGLQVALAPQSVGDKLITCIEHEVDSNGEDMGDPEISPYAFKWTYNPNATKPADYYNVYAYRRANYTRDIQELIDGQAIDIANYIAPGNSKDLRKIFEQGLKVDVDLDIAFDNCLDADEPDNSGESYDHETGREDQVPETDSRRAATPLEDTGEVRDDRSTNGNSDSTDSEPGTETSDSSTQDGTCETCGGYGTIGKKHIECPDCGGTGLDPESDSGSSDQSGGTESDDNGPTLVECDTCGGTGKIGKKGMQCPDCEGTGQVEAEPEEGDGSSNSEPEPEPTKENKTVKPKAESKPSGEPEMVKCGVCKKLMPDVDICPHCGTDFSDDDEGDD